MSFKKLRIRDLWGYASGEGAAAVTMNGISAFAMLFYTQILILRKCPLRANRNFGIHNKFAKCDEMIRRPFVQLKKIGHPIRAGGKPYAEFHVQN